MFSLLNFTVSWRAKIDQKSDLESCVPIAGQNQEVPGIQSAMSVKIEWFDEYEGRQGYIKDLYRWLESMFTFCKSQINIKPYLLVWGVQVSL